MVHKFKNKVDNFLFSEMPVDSMDYERKGGCFVTISKGVLLTILFIIFGFLLGLLVFYTTKHAYQNKPLMSIEEFIENSQDENYEISQETIAPKHYRLIFNSMLNESLNQFSFTGNVWITITPNHDHIRTIELDAKNLDIRADDVTVYRSRILSDSNFQLTNDRDERSAQLVEDDASVEDDQSDLLMSNSTEWIDSNTPDTSAEKESQELPGEDKGNDIDTTTTELNETGSEDETTKFEVKSSSEQPEPSVPSEPSVTEFVEYNDTNTMWDGLFQNDSMLREPNPDDQTHLQIDGIRFDAVRQKLIITLNTALRRGHYYIVKVFFSGNMTNDYGLVYKSYDGTSESGDDFVAATVTDPHHTPVLFPCFNSYLKDVTFQLNLIRRNDHQSVSVSKLIRSQKITNDWTLDAYQRTYPMMLNNFGFVITNIPAVVVTVTPDLMINSYFRPKLLPNITFIDSVIPSLLKKIEWYTNSTYPLESISFIGMPSSTHDVIEIKKGLVIASESFFIAYDDTDKQNKELTISHVVGKVWSQPWEIIEFEDQQWINEALSMQLIMLGDRSYTSSNLSSESMINKRMESLRREQSFLDINLKEFRKRSLDDNWIYVAQSKGLYVLTLLEDLLTKPIYQTGLQRFFKSNGTTNFLETLGNLNADSSKSMEQCIHEWTQQIGYPIIHIRQIGANKVQIEEMELASGNLRQSNPHFWSTHITINNQTLWLQNNGTKFDIEDDWLTVKSTGYFRVNYDGDRWQTILKALQMNHKILSANDRAVLIDDAFNLAKYNYLDYSIVQQLLERWNDQEMEYLPWKAALVNLEFVYKNSIDFSIGNGFNTLLSNLTQRAYKNIVRSPLGGMPHKLKVLIKKWSCQIFALSDCVADAQKDFQNLIINDTLTLSQRSATDVEQLYCTVIRFGDAQSWHLVRNSFDPTNNHNYNKALLYSLGCSTDLRILGEYFSLLLDSQYKDYAGTIVRSMNDNQIGQKYALEYFYTNFQQLQQMHGLPTLKTLLKGISTTYDYKLFQMFYSANSDLFTFKDRKTMAEIVNSIRSNLKWKNDFADAFSTS
ncbi:aminopeptidase Ey-like [Bradysia coprophila]|uniref:aminopeptidase Ey-like n=1 Tax=Bradysia coprophila TaxID=38358 RepID=UPI00187D8124|nr:aminopeptidase Ey-like [Bradysia coprophila]